MFFGVKYKLEGFLLCAVVLFIAVWLLCPRSVLFQHFVLIYAHFLVFSGVGRKFCIHIKQYIKLQFCIFESLSS